MRFAQTQIITNGNMASASVTSIGIDMNQQVVASISAAFTGSPVGTFKLQISNDIVPVAGGSLNTNGGGNYGAAGIPVGTDPAANVVNWSDYTGSSQSISAAGNFTWNLLDMGYRWIRLVYTKTSGTGTVNAYITSKGV